MMDAVVKDLMKGRADIRFLTIRDDILTSVGHIPCDLGYVGHQQFHFRTLKFVIFMRIDALKWGMS